MKNQFTVHSSNGTITADKTTGVVKEIENTSGEKFFSQIKQFDVQEYLQYAKVRTMPDDVDILNLGYWYGKKMKYEEPAQDWREEMSHLSIHS